MILGDVILKFRCQLLNISTFYKCILSIKENFWTFIYPKFSLGSVHPLSPSWPTTILTTYTWNLITIILWVSWNQMPASLYFKTLQMHFGNQRRHFNFPPKLSLRLCPSPSWPTTIFTTFFTNILTSISTDTFEFHFELDYHYLSSCHPIIRCQLLNISTLCKCILSIKENI